MLYRVDVEPRDNKNPSRLVVIKTFAGQRSLNDLVGSHKERRVWQTTRSTTVDEHAVIRAERRDNGITSSGVSVSVFDVGIGIRYFCRYFFTSVRYSVSVF